MVFEPEYMKVVSSVRKNLGIMQSVVELKLPTNEDVIDTIYSVGARSTIVSSETAGNEVSFTGLVDFQAMYESAGVSAVDYSAEFKDKFISNNELSGEIILTSNVIDVTSNIVANGIRVVAIVETIIDEIKSKDVSVLTAVQGDRVFSSTTEMTYSTYVGKAVEKFEVTSDFSIASASKILMVTPNVCVKDIVAKDNYLTVSGLLSVSVCYQEGDAEANIKTFDHCIDFSFDSAMDGIRDDSCVYSNIATLFNEIKVSTMLEENGASVDLYVPLMFAGYVFNSQTVEVVDDVYSQDNYLSVTSENFDTLQCAQAISFSDNIMGTASIVDTAPFIDEILGVSTNNIVLASSNIVGDKLAIEGIVNSTVLYYTKESNAITSVQVEMPFMVEEKVNAEQSSIVSLCLKDVSARSRRGKEIEVSAELKVYSDLYCSRENSVITNVAIGDEKPQDDSSLYIYIVKPGETIWDIAKNMNVSPDVILEQNPDVSLPLQPYEKLVIYKPQMFDF